MANPAGRAHAVPGDPFGRLPDEVILLVLARAAVAVPPWVLNAVCPRWRRLVRKVHGAGPYLAWAATNENTLACWLAGGVRPLTKELAFKVVDAGNLEGLKAGLHGWEGGWYRASIVTSRTGPRFVVSTWYDPPGPRSEPWSVTELAVHAACRGSLDILIWLHSEGVAFPADMLGSAAAQDAPPDTLGWLRERGW